MWMTTIQPSAARPERVHVTLVLADPAELANWSVIACRSDASPETIAWAAAYDKKMAEINKKLGR